MMSRRLLQRKCWFESNLTFNFSITSGIVPPNNLPSRPTALDRMTKPNFGATALPPTVLRRQRRSWDGFFRG